MTGLIMLAHGSRVEETCETCNRILQDVKRAVAFDHAETAFLQFAKPELGEVVDRLYNVGCREIVVFPFFLFKGHHVRKDIPAALARLSPQYADLQIRVLDSIGYDPKLVDIIVSRVKGA